MPANYTRILTVALRMIPESWTPTVRDISISQKDLEHIILNSDDTENLVPLILLKKKSQKTSLKT